MLGYVAYCYFCAYAFQRTQSISVNRFTAPAAPAIKHDIAEGTAIGRMEIARLGLSVTFLEGDSSSILRRAVGHVPGTAMPGEPGNIALAGHRDTFFRALRQIRDGDTVTVDTESGEYRYIVESTSIVAPTDTEVLNSRGRDELTLVTCYPFYYIGPAPDRFIVHARRLTSVPVIPREHQ
jgi:sortase A